MNKAILYLLLASFDAVHSFSSKGKLQCAKINTVKTFATIDENNDGAGGTFTSSRRTIMEKAIGITVTGALAIGGNANVAHALVSIWVFLRFLLFFPPMKFTLSYIFLKWNNDFVLQK